MRCLMFATLVFWSPSLFAADFPTKIKPVLVWTGTETKQPKETFARCISQKGWQAIWDAHCVRKKGENLTCLEIDFDSFMVVAIFHMSSRLQIAEVVEKTEGILVRYKPWGNQIFFLPGSDGKHRVYESGRGEIDPKGIQSLSFAFVVIPRSTKAMILEEDAQSVIGKPPVWKERAKFATLKEK